MTNSTEVVRTARAAALTAFLMLAVAACSHPGDGAASTGPTSQPPVTTEPTQPTSSEAPTTSVTTGAPGNAPARPDEPTAPTPVADGCDQPPTELHLPGGHRAVVRSPGGTTPHPAVVVLHGFRGSPELVERTSGWTPFARTQGALAVYPEGEPTDDQFAWNTGSATFSGAERDDIALLADLVPALVRTACADPARIYLTGESNGGALTLLAACDARTRVLFAGFAPVIPAIDTHVLDRCGDGPPVSFTAIASRNDETIRYDGDYPAGAIPFLAQERWFSTVGERRNGCRPDSLTRASMVDAQRIILQGCSARSSLIAVDDGVHTWPGGPIGSGGLRPGSFPTTATLWSEFTGR